MTWIFSSFLVTPCALASCHILISKQQCDQGTRVQQVCNRNENHAVRFRQSAQNRSRAWDTQPIRCIRGSLTMACKRVQVLAPPGSQKKIWEEEVLSLSICLSIYLSNQQLTVGLSRIK